MVKNGLGKIPMVLRLGTLWCKISTVPLPFLRFPNIHCHSIASTCVLLQYFVLQAVWLPQSAPTPACGDLNSHPERPGDLDLWPFDLGTGAECQPWHGQHSRQFCCFCDFSLSSREQACIRLTTWPYYLDLRPLTSRRMSVMHVIILHPCTKFEIRRVPLQ